MIIWPDCPLLPPTLGHLCVPPTTANDCHYNTDHCCCGNCPQRFTFSCAVDSTTGAGLWEKLHSSICPAHGCGKEGAYYVAKPRSRPEVRISIIDKGRRQKKLVFFGNISSKRGEGGPWFLNFGGNFLHEITLYTIDRDQKWFRTPFLTL